MKNILLVFVLLSTSIFGADNWDRTQLNLKLKKDDFAIKYRTYVAGFDSDGEIDKWHWQLSYKIDNWRLDYQLSLIHI